MIELRGLTAGDRPRLARLLERAAAFNAADRAVALELIDDALSRGEASDYRFICAVAEDGLAGYVCFGRVALTESSFDLYWIVVNPASQGQGVGRGLLAAAESACRQLGGTQLFAETSSLPDYGPARAFYEAAGYELVSHIADFYAPGNDRLIYGKKLA
jgi:ribosomal protein S18 acetylase RimI-like enzyme